MKKFSLRLCVSAALLLPLLLSGCGRSKAQKEELAIHEKWQTENLAALKAVTPAESPLAPGVGLVSDAQTKFYESLIPFLPPVSEIEPSKILPAVPFREADAAAKQAEAAALAAGKNAVDAAALGKQAADAYVWKPAFDRIMPALQVRQAEAEKACKPSETGWIGSILGGLSSVAGLFGPIGAAISGVLGIGLAAWKWVENKKITKRTTALVAGIEKTVQAGKTKGWLTPEVKTEIYGNLAQAQNLIADGAEFAKWIAAQKETLRK